MAALGMAKGEKFLYYIDVLIASLGGSVAPHAAQTA
jgi:hypothetical protein